MKYIFEVNVYTDGDFSLPFVPIGMHYDGYCQYNFEKSYEDRDTAVKDIINICEFLKAHMSTHKSSVKDSWDKCINDFVSFLPKYDKVRQGMSGNYDETEFNFYTVDRCVSYIFNVTDEEYEMIHNNKNITEENIKEAILDLFKE